MPLVSRILFSVAVVGTVTSFLYCGMVVVAGLRFGARRRRVESAPADFLPPISVLKPLHGAEEGLERNLQTFFEQRYPKFELLFCARQENDEGLLLAQSLARRYPGVRARFLACGEPLFPNPKMYSLAVMAEAARFEHLVTSDADARVAPDYLQRCVQVLQGDSVSLASCLYLGEIDRGGLMTRLDALGKSVEMTSGVLVADMLAGTDFALGVTMILRRQAFEQGGGYEDLGQYWAEDFVLGHRLAQQGQRVEISSHVIRLMVTAESFAASFYNQLRWMQSTRRSRPWGHLGTGLTFAMPFGLLGFAVEAVKGRWVAALTFLLVAVVNRMLQAAVVLRELGSDKVPGQTLLYPLRDLLGGLIWVCSYLPADTRYHGTSFRITPDGRLRKE